MGRKNVTLAVGVVLLIGLSGVYFALKSYNEKTEQEAAIEAEGEEILSMDVNSVTELEFTIGNEQVSFVLEDDMWKKTDDGTFPVDEDALLSPLSQFASLKAIRILENTEDSSEYGMDEPQKIIRMTDSDGAETTVTIGATNAGTGNDYVMLNNDDSVIYTVDAGVRTAFSDDLYDYAVSEELPYLQAADITAVSVEKATGSYHVYLEDAVWKVSEISEALIVEEGTAKEGTAQPEAEVQEVLPESENETVMEADADLINDALADLTGLTYSDYLEHNCKDGATYGLDVPTAILTVYWKEESEAEEETDEVLQEENSADSETEEETSSFAEEAGAENESETEAASIAECSLTLYIGNTDDLGNYYVQQEGSGEIHTISSAALAAFLDSNAVSWEIVEEETETEAGTEEEIETEAMTE